MLSVNSTAAEGGEIMKRLLSLKSNSKFAARKWNESNVHVCFGHTVSPFNINLCSYLEVKWRVRRAMLLNIEVSSTERTRNDST